VTPRQLSPNNRMLLAMLIMLLACGESGPEETSVRLVATFGGSTPRTLTGSEATWRTEPSQRSGDPPGSQQLRIELAADEIPDPFAAPFELQLLAYGEAAGATTGVSGSYPVMGSNPDGLVNIFLTNGQTFYSSESGSVTLEVQNERLVGSLQVIFEPYPRGSSGLPSILVDGTFTALHAPDNAP
jgi:hypothetical protein